MRGVFSYESSFFFNFWPLYTFRKQDLGLLKNQKKYERHRTETVSTIILLWIWGGTENYSYPGVHCTVRCSTKNLSNTTKNLSNINSFSSVPFSNWFGTKQNSTWFQINSEIINTICIYNFLIINKNLRIIYFSRISRISYKYQEF